MSNYAVDFESAPVGAGVPSGWTSRWDGGTWSVVDDGGHLVRENTGTANRYLISNNDVDADADRASADVLIKFRIASYTTGTTHAGAVARGSGTSTTETGYAALIVDTSGARYLRLAKYVNGALTAIGTDVAKTVTANTWHWLRFRVNGTTLNARVWADGSSEPGTWDRTNTDSSISAAGWCGVLSFAASINKDFADVAIATNGDTATMSSSIVLEGAATATASASASLAGATIDLAGAAAAQAAASGTLDTIVIDAAYERSSLEVANSTVVGTGDAAVISLRPRTIGSEVTADVARWLEPSARISGVNGLRPTFRFLSYTASAEGDHGHPWAAGRRPMFSYDGLAWTYFDSPTTRVDGSYIEFRHSTAFTANTVYISRSRQRSVTQIGQWLADLATAHTYIEPTTSAAAFTPAACIGFPAQAYIADEYGAQTDELGGVVPATPFYAAQINDTSLMPPVGGKRLAVLVGGVHAGEDHGNVIYQLLVDYLCGNTVEAHAVRRAYRILLYPMLNAPGRYGGHWRGSFQEGASGADDANRHFSDAAPGLEIVTKPRAAMITDRGALVPDWMFDLHGTYSATWAMFLDQGRPYETALWSRLQAQSGLSISDEGDTAAGFVSRWWRDTVGVPMAVTIENGDQAPVTDTALTNYAAALGRTLAELIDDGVFAGLAGAATATATATAALAAGAVLSGLAVATASASGNLATQITLAGASLALAQAGGALTAQITLAGAALAQALAAAGLTTGTGGLEGAAQAQAAATANLSVQIRLSGAALSAAAGSGTLDNSAAALAGDAVGAAAATGTLTVVSQLTSAALSAAAASGALVTQILLGGTAAATVAAGGNLSTQAADVSGRLLATLSRPCRLATYAAPVATTEVDHV